MSTSENESEHQMSRDELVQKARQLLTILPAPINKSEKTKQEYGQIFSRLYANVKIKASEDDTLKTRIAEEFWLAICNTQKKNTYQLRLAAVKYCIRRVIEDSLRDHKYGSMRFAIQLHEILETNKGTCPLKDPIPRRSKRKDMQRLSADWRVQLLAQMKDSIYYLPALVMVITGCRPEELEKGVKISKSDGLLRFETQGAKLKDTQGQPHRHVIYDADDNNVLVKSFVESNFACPGIIKVSKKQNYTAAIRKYCLKIWPKRKLSPICLRHQTASDQKSTLSPEEVSMSLGHLSSATKTRYGYKSSGKGGPRPVSVGAARPIKTKSVKLSRKPY